MLFYLAVNKNNQKIKGITDMDENELRTILAEQNFYLLRTKNQAKKTIKFKGKISLINLAALCRHWSVLLNSGMEMTHALVTMRDYLDNKKLRSILTAIIIDLVKGGNVHLAFKTYEKVFPPFFIQMLEIGERINQLETILKQLSYYYEKENQIKQKVKNAFQYPKILLILCLLVFIALILFVLPVFNQMFLKLGGKLPWISIFSHKIKDLFTNNQLLIGIVLFGSFLLIKKYQRKKRYPFIDKIKLKTPLYNQLYLANLTNRFIKGLVILQKGAIGIIECLELLKHLMQNTFIEKRFDDAIRQIKEGNSLSGSLNKMKIFPLTLMEMISIGERSGNLTILLEDAIPFFEDQVMNHSTRLTTLIEPFMVMVIALVVVLILFTVFFPILRLLDFNW